MKISSNIVLFAGKFLLLANHIDTRLHLASEFLLVLIPLRI